MPRNLDFAQLCATSSRVKSKLLPESASLNVTLEDVLPPQAQWDEWTRRCLALTEVWHGAPNVSAMYQLLCECSEYDGIAPYRFGDVPVRWSADGWTRAVDGRVRNSFAAKAKELAEARGPSALAQAAGESAIDNSVLPNILTAEESRVRRKREISL